MVLIKLPKTSPNRKNIVTIKRSVEDTLDMCKNIINQLKNDCVHFDNGQKDYDAQIANKISILLNDGKYQSAFSLINAINNMRFLDTSDNEILENNFKKTKIYVSGSDLLSIEIKFGTIVFKPILNGNLFTEMKPFKKWWKQSVVYTHESNLDLVEGFNNVYKERLTRKDIVLFLRDQNSGAHLDENIDKKFNDLSNNFLNLEINKNEVSFQFPNKQIDINNELFKNYLNCLSKQIAFELLCSISKSRFLIKKLS